MDNAVAVVGLAARFPGSPTVDAFWNNLRDGVESITTFSDEELTAAGIDARLLAHPRYVKAKPVLDGIEEFDAALFGMAAREAEITDPQHRVFLEICHEALERSGHAPDQFSGAIGVFAGAGLSSYLLHNLVSRGDESAAADTAQLGLGNVQDFVATRVAYKLNLKGPAYSVQAACSTSLVAVHLACQNLLGYECDLALAGGASIGLPMRCGYLYQEEGMLSPDGHCRPFDADARGTVFGSGAGVVVLKRYADAVEAGDQIYAVVLGSAVNNDGGLKAGFTAPSVVGQASVITEALANAGVSADSIGYVEAHGTGTILGDPIEIEALTRAFRPHTTRRQFCALGSVKSNIGHLDSAAGIAGFIKAVLAVHHGDVPPSLHFDQPNPRIDFAATPFFVNTAARRWPIDGPRRAGVSAFGVGGTNAHVVLQEAPAPRRSGAGRRWHVLPLAARSERALEQTTTNLADFLDDHPDTSIADVAYTLQVGRRSGEHRRVTVVESTDEAVDRLLDLPPRDVFTLARRASARPLVFMFPGQGAQASGMGAELYRDEPTFARELDRCCARLAAVAGFDVLPFTLSDDDRAADRMRDADAEQCALFAFEYALAKLWLSWGVEPEALIGLSLGEIAAATIAGVFSLDDACALVGTRARLAAALPAGAMLAVPLSADDLRPLLDPTLALALLNGRNASVVSGTRSGIAGLSDRLAARGVDTRLLDSRCAYHSPEMEAIADPIAGMLRGMTLNPPHTPFVSGATGRLITREEATDPQYWVRQMRHPVYFGDGIRELLKDPSRVFLEVGPGLTLTSLTRQNADPASTPAILASLPDPRERRPVGQGLLTTLARVWVAGIDVNWTAFHAGEQRCRLALPTYPFDRQRYWIEPSHAAATAADDATPRRIDDVAGWFSVPTWTRRPLAGLTAAGPERPGPTSASVGPGLSRTVVGPGLSGRAERWLLLFDDGDALGDAMTALLASRGHAVTRVPRGPRFDRASAFTDLFDSLAADGNEPDVIVHAWSGGTGAEATERAFYSLLWLGQALGARAPRPIDLAVVTPGIHSVLGTERVQPESAMALGPAIVIGQEHPHIRCRAIDVDAYDGRDGLKAVPDERGVPRERGVGNGLQAVPPRGAVPNQTARMILDEITADDIDRVVALRNGLRWVRRVEPIRILEAGRPLKRLKPRGVYLITGGSGGIGLTLARFLVRELQARLILVARRAPDVSGEDILGAADAEIMAVAADVSDPDAMRAVVRDARARFGRIDGVVHAAGVAGGGLIALKTRDAAAKVLAAKVGGTRALELALGDDPLDFFLVCSSLAALAGGVGQVDYCAANIFLDAWAAARARERSDAISVNWDAWRTVGMAVMAVQTTTPAEWKDVRAEQLAVALSPDEGVEVFRRVLDQDYPQVAVCAVGLEARLRAAPRPRQAPSRTLHPRPALTTAYVAPVTAVEQRLAAAWQDVLGLDGVGALDNFFDLGGDSLTALRVVDRLRDEQGVSLSIAAFYAAPTIRLLADALA